MRALSKEAETKLLAAIERAAGLVNDGAAPNDAIVKVASAAEIPAGHISLMVHAYNTGRTNKQREAGENPLEKSADFPLADLDTVMAALYPKEVKTAAEISRATAVSSEYALSPAGMLARRKAQLTKEAAGKVQLPEKTYQPYPRDEHEAARRAYSEKKAAIQSREEMRRQVTDAYNKAAAKMEQLHEYFRHPGNLSFPDAVQETELRYGPEAVSALKKLSSVYPFLAKQAATRSAIIGDCIPCALADEVVTALAEYNEKQQKFAAAYPPVVDKKKELPQPVTGSILRNPATEPLQLKSAGMMDTFTAPISATMGVGNTLLEQGVGGLTEASPDKMRAKALMDLTDPEHERKLHTIKSRGVLHDLMLNDPVISGYDPNDVANAYNELAELAPSYTSSTAAMSALLRKRLEAGQLADFDIKQIVDLESRKTEQKKNLADAYQRQLG